ncbi:hypothetical protein [Paenibacillus kobensis]|uniref:hypothetical protein n=1 Tax=Paenibacillus kobensis TaxID=59841 RepID=UPI000FD8315D|nr:hypothetical protein [Paenibacillus kobensis]
MPNLPSGLRTFEASETVRRLAQNENIEATDRLFHDNEGHRHTGKPGDAPQIGASGLASGAVTSDKLASGAVTSDKLASSAVTSDKLGTGAVTGDKLAKGSVERVHLRSAGLSSNIAKYKKVTVTGGNVTGNPTTPFTFQTGFAGDSHLWTLPVSTALPQSLTIHLGQEYMRLEGLSFGSWVGSDQSTVPTQFYIEASPDNTVWTRVYTHAGQIYEPFQFLPFNPVPASCKFIRFTVMERSEGRDAVVSCLAVYSRFHGNVDLDALEDVRPWGLNARLQGLMIVPEADISDNGSGQLTLTEPLTVMNPASGTYFRVNKGIYALPEWGYLYVDFPHAHGVLLNPSVAVWTDGSRNYDAKNRLILAQRCSTGPIYMNAALQARIAGKAPNADKVDGIDFRTSNGYLEYNSGTGWNGVGIKSVQRGKVFWTTETWQIMTVPISPVNLSKSFVNVRHTGSTSIGNIYDSASIDAHLNSSTELQMRAAYDSQYFWVSWEVVEYA